MTVRVVHGVNDDTLPLEGRTVGFVAENLRDVFNIPAEAVALLNGDPAITEDLLATGDLLEFVQRWGHKGCGSEYLAVADARRMVGDKGICELGAAGINPENILAHKTADVLRWINERLELDSQIVKERKPVSARGLTVDPETRQASFKGVTIDLQEKPFELLYLLVNKYRPGRKHTLAEIRCSVWQDDLTSDDTVRRTISRLREPLEKFPGIKLPLSGGLLELLIE